MTAEIIEISRLALHDQVAARLRTMLVEGHIAPGAKLNERELCLQLRVSRTPLREAIKLLAAEGLVDLLPNRGAVAVKLTENDVVDTFEVLAMLEGMSGELAAKRITDEQLAEVRAMHYEMMACFTRRDLSGLSAGRASLQCRHPRPCAHTPSFRARASLCRLPIAKRSPKALRRPSAAPTGTCRRGAGHQYIASLQPFSAIS